MDGEVLAVVLQARALPSLRAPRLPLRVPTALAGKGSGVIDAIAPNNGFIPSRWKKACRRPASFNPAPVPWLPQCAPENGYSLRCVVAPGRHWRKYAGALGQGHADRWAPTMAEPSCCGAAWIVASRTGRSSNLPSRWMASTAWPATTKGQVRDCPRAPDACREDRSLPPGRLCAIAPRGRRAAARQRPSEAEEAEEATRSSPSRGRS